MKTVERKYYVCQICGKASLKETAIAECERKHKIIDDTCTVTPYYGRGQAFPKALDIRFSDGSRAYYALDFCEDPPATETAGAI